MKKFITITLGLAMMIALVAYASPPAKVTICHATGSEENPYNTLHVSENAIGGHFENPGTPKDGHEDDLFFLGEVDCPTPPPPVDVCPNIEDNQATVPEGMEIVDGLCVEIVTPPVDVCPNIEDVQTTIPEGKELVDGQCIDIVTPPEDPEDLCDNIEDVQEVIPEGMEEHDGVCAVPEDPEDNPEEENDGGGSSGSHRSSGSRRTGSVLSTSTTCAMPVALTGFDVQSAIPNDGQNELVWNKLNSFVVKPGDNFNPWTGISILDNTPGTVIYGTNVTSVNIRWWEDVPGDIAYQSTVSANDGFEAIPGLRNGTHHWFQLQPVNDCGVGDWGVAVDPLP